MRMVVIVMDLVLSGYGSATAYATVAVGGFNPERDHVLEAIERARRKARQRAALSHRPYVDPILSSEVVYLLGQSDLALVLDVHDMRDIFDLRYPSATSNASLVNWNFGVCYEIADLDGVSSPGSSDRMRFIIHLRLRRDAYAYRDAEGKIITAIIRLLGGSLKSSRILAGLGWSDLVVDGYFTQETFADFTEFVINLHGLHLLVGRAPKRLPVLQRMLTVMGYPDVAGKEPPDFEGGRHLMYVRATPGYYDDIETGLKKFGHVFILDGKTDYVVFFDDPRKDFLEQQRALAIDPDIGRHIHKTETHLMYMPAWEFNSAETGKDLTVGREDRVRHQECSCGHHSDTSANDIGKAMDALIRDDLLPEEKRYAIDNMLFLLGRTLRDPSICCDVVTAVSACYKGLLDIFDAIRSKWTAKLPDHEIQADDVHRAFRRQHAEIVRLWEALDDWHRFAELLLRQRTVGSYEEILGQTDRSVVYSGGVQKFLYLADQLVHDFASRTDPNPPLLATIYDSVKTVLSVRGGLVRIPTRVIFQLPLAISDLWHEVGVALFWLRLEKRYSAKIEEGLLKRAFVESLADHYADLIVYLYGFGGRFERFMASFVDGWARAHRHETFSVKANAVTQFVLRAYLVYEFDQVRQADHEPDSERRELFEERPEEAATDLNDELHRFFLDRMGRKTFQELPLRPEHWTQLYRNVTTTDFAVYHRSLYRDLRAIQVVYTQPDLTPFERGEIVPFRATDPLNDYFAELAYWIQSPDRAEDLEAPFFRMMAALGKSAAIEYHRRQITRAGLT